MKERGLWICSRDQNGRGELGSQYYSTETRELFSWGDTQGDGRREKRENPELRKVGRGMEKTPCLMSRKQLGFHHPRG